MKKRIALMLIILLFATFVPFYVDAGSTIYYYEPYPQGEIGIKNPEIGWKVKLEGNEVESAKFYLNGVSLDVYYDQTRETFYAKPNKLLSGTNTVSASIKLKNWSNTIKRTWSFTVAPDSLSSLPVANGKQNTAINFANDYRYALGNSLYSINNSLNMSAQKHADYQANLGVFSHYQEINTTGFFGVSVADRAGYYGFYGNTGEDISYQSDPSVQKAVDSLFDAPYHRIPFLIPSYDSYGYGVNGYYHVINFGSLMDKNAKWVAYPTPDQTNIPIAWDNYETPDPLRFYSDAPRRVGYPIVVGVYGEDVTSVKLVSAKLWDSANKEVPVYINSPKNTGGNDEELKNEVFLIPKSPLKLSEKYKVSVKLEVIENNTLKTYDKTWYFTTEAKSGTGVNELHQTVVYPPYSKETESIQYWIGQKYTVVDDVGYPLDAVPFIENGRLMVPFRALGNSLGATVDWNETTKTVIYSKDNLVIEVPINSNKVKVNGETIILDQGAILLNGRSYVPSRFVSEQLGADVTWISDKQEVLIKVK